MHGDLPIVLERRDEPPHFSFLDLPASPGVLVIEARGGETVFVGVTADLRSAARRRLDAPVEGAGVGRGADLRPVAHRVLAATAGFALEAELLYARVAAARRPDDHRAAVERWQGWFLHIDPDGRPPAWGKVCVPGWSGGRPAPGSGELIGPFRDKHAAGRYAELLDDLFDLCRYPNILAQAPRGQACAYKEMGKCPAPCDGSEPIGSYRSRLLGALRFASGSAQDAAGEVERRMRAAAARMDFEGAAREKALLTRVEALAAPGFRHARSFDRFRWLVVGRSEKAGWARLLVIDGAGARAVADVRCEEAGAALSDVWGAINHAPGGVIGDAAAQEAVGLLCSRLFLGAGVRGRHERYVRLGDAGDFEEAERAARSVWKSRPKTEGPFDDACMEFSGTDGSRDARS